MTSNGLISCPESDGSMTKRLVNGVFALILFSLSAFLIGIIAYLVSSEVMPAIEQGTLSVQTSTMVLNRVWEGNEICVLLAAYTLTAIAFGYGGIRFTRKAIGR